MAPPGSTAADAPIMTRDAGFVRGVRDALARRRYTEAVPGQRIEGIYRRRVDLASGRFALIEKSRELTLALWRPVLERNLGKQVSGVVRGGEISWNLERRRSGPTVS